jgi:hypothetical protein
VSIVLESYSSATQKCYSSATLEIPQRTTLPRYDQPRATGMSRF